ncbi:MAG: hypothetical protein QM479_00260 [Pseudomonadota bacterium]
MSECYSSSSNREVLLKKYKCPVNGLEYKAVSTKTILQHINKPWLWQSKQRAYYFCDDPQCQVVYFADDGSIIEKSELRTTVGVKEISADATICYCFGIKRNDARASPAIKTFVVEKTKQHDCACDTRNPSGKCCLKDFPFIAASKTELSIPTSSHTSIRRS